MRWRALLALALKLVASVLLLATWPALAQAQAAPELRVGSKRFTESYILAELIAQTAQAAGAKTQVRQGLGNTAIVYEALRSGQIDVYAEYTGTIAQELVQDPAAGHSLPALNAALRAKGLALTASVPLGFNDGYALAMKREHAQALQISKLSDLARHPALKFGLSNEFLGRADGWRSLAQAYGLPHSPRGLDHGLAYEALAQGQIEVMDIYTTDAKIEHLGLLVLQDDRQHFPRYDAVLLHRADLPQRQPAAWQALQTLAGRISEADMIAMNAQAELQGKSFGAIARGFLQRSGAAGALSGAQSGAKAASPASNAPDASAPPPQGGHAPTSIARPPSAPAATNPAHTPSTAQQTPSTERPSFWRQLWQRLWGEDLWRLTAQHLLLVLVSVGAASVIAVPLGIALFPHARLRALALGAAGVLQTIPALALLAVLIALLGVIGRWPALIALTAYSVLPILSNTCAGLTGVPPGLRNAAAALGMTGGQRLAYIELPLALPTVLAGIRTASAIAIGTATIAAFIGAGGLGERIVTGLALNDSALMLAGALPAAGLALLSELLFETLDWRLRRRLVHR